MGRVVQPVGWKGSQRWFQHMVNGVPQLLEGAIGIGPIDWVSPLAVDEYAEYRDEAFLERLGLALTKRSLSSFWPAGGPQWDGLGCAKSGEVVLVEAKAHLKELHSPPSGASEPSLSKIQLALRETAIGLGADETADWSQQHYQYASRLAHAYLLNALNGIPAKLAFVYFIGDDDADGPGDRAGWESAIGAVHRTLGLAGLPPFVVNAFIDVRTPAPMA